MNKCKSFVSVVLGCAGAFVASASQAHASELQWSVTLGTPPIVYPVPAYARPMPVVVPSAPIALRRAVPVQQVAYRTPTRWDVDGDGIPNRQDRLYNPQWDRDGDGVPNRYDRHDPRAWHRR
jgi:hypothetical protein